MLYSENELNKRLRSGCGLYYFYAADEALVHTAAQKALKVLNETRHDIKGVMKEALSSRVPCIVDCWIDKDDCVYPIIPPGKSGKDIILYGN